MGSLVALYASNWIRSPLLSSRTPSSPSEYPGGACDLEAGCDGGGKEVDDEGVLDAGEDVALRVHMLHLAQAHDLALAKDLHREVVVRLAPPMSDDENAGERARACGSVSTWKGAIR